MKQVLKFLIYCLIAVIATYGCRQVLNIFGLGGSGKEGGVSLIFFGDGGTGKPAQYRVAAGMSLFCNDPVRCQFALMLGDNFYPTGVAKVDDEQFSKKFEKPYSDLNFPFYVAVGNHDHVQDPLAQVEYSKKNKKWVLPALYHHFSRGQVEFFILDTTRFAEDQVQWLQQKLSQSQARWKVVAGHHPVYSYGHHGETPVLVEQVAPLLDQFGVQFYLAGHDHDKQHISRGKTQFIVCGTAAKLRPVALGEGSLFAKSSLGFCSLKFTTNQAFLGIYNEEAKLEYGASFTHSSPL